MRRPTTMKYVRDKYDNLIDKYPVRIKRNQDTGILEEFDEDGNLVDNTGLNYSYAIGYNL